MKNNESNQKIDQLVKSITYQVNSIFNLSKEELEGFATNLSTSLIDTLETYHITGVSGWVYRNQYFTYYNFAFEVSQISNLSADALVSFAYQFTDGEALIKSIQEIPTGIMTITFFI